MNKQTAYRYLKTHGGLDFLFEHWWALHTDNPLYVVRDLYDICYQKEVHNESFGLKRYHKSR